MMKTDDVECRNTVCLWHDPLFEFSCGQGESPQPEKCKNYIPAWQGLNLHEQPVVGE